MALTWRGALGGLLLWGVFLLVGGVARCAADELDEDETAGWFI